MWLQIPNIEVNVLRSQGFHIKGFQTEIEGFTLRSQIEESQIGGRGVPVPN